MDVFAGEDNIEEDGSTNAALKLFRLGRPLWGGRCHPDKAPEVLARELIDLASQKTGGNGSTKSLALISYRLEFYVTNSHLADEMMSNCLRHVAFINKERDYMRTMQPSEPILAYSAALKMIKPEVRLEALREFMLSCFEGSLMSPGDVGEMVASLIFLFAYDEKQFDNQMALPKPVLLQDFMESLFGSERCDEMAQRMTADVDMKKLWETGIVYFNHFVKLRKPPTLETLGDAFSRAAAFFLPNDFPGADITIPVKIPGVAPMTFCAVQVKNRKHDAFTPAVRRDAMSKLGEAVDKLEWSQNHIAIMMCLRSKKSTTEASTTSKQFEILLPEKAHSHGTRKARKLRKAQNASSAAGTDETEYYNWPSQKKRLVLLAMGVEESVYPSINLCGGKRMVDGGQVSSLLKQLLDCMPGTSLPEDVDWEYINRLLPLH